jgi:hypothetical protein
MEPGDVIRPIVIGIGMMLGIGIALYYARRRQQ